VYAHTRLFADYFRVLFSFLTYIKGEGLGFSFLHPPCCGHERKVDGDAADEAGKGVDGVVGLDVNSGEAQEDVEGQEDVEQAAVARVPREQHKHRAYAHVTARKGGGGPLSCGFGLLNELIEYAVGVAGRWQTVLVMGEIVVQVGEHALRNVFHAHGVVIERWPRDGHEDEHHVVDEERGKHNEGRPLKLGVAEEEVEDDYKGYHGVVRGVAHVHQFAHHGPRQRLAEEQRGLAAEESLLPRGEDVVKVWQLTVYLVCVRIPPT